MPYNVDIVADSGLRVTDSINFSNTSASVDEFISKANAALAATGWTLNTSGVSGGHNSYTYTSKQSPWWDDTAIPPSNYIGKVKITIHGNNTGGGRFLVDVGDTSGTYTPTTFIQSQPGLYHITVCPFQFLSYPRVRDGIRNYILVSAIHTPKFIQNDLNLTEMIVAESSSTGFTDGLYSVGELGTFLLCSSDLGTTFINTTLNGNTPIGLVIPTLSSQFNPSQQAIYIPNPYSDPTLATQNKWFPFHSPAQVAWPDTNGSLATNNILLRGWFWDMMVFSFDPNNTTWQIQYDNGQIYENMTIKDNSGSEVIGAAFVRTS